MLREKCSSRHSSSIVLPRTKNSRRTRAIESTPFIAALGAFVDEVSDSNRLGWKIQRTSDRSIAAPPAARLHRPHRPPVAIRLGEAWRAPRRPRARRLDEPPWQSVTDNAKAESFMKTLKVEAVYLAGTSPLRGCRHRPSPIYRRVRQHSQTTLRLGLSLGVRTAGRLTAGPARAREGAAPRQGHRGDPGDRQARLAVAQCRLPADAARQRRALRGGRSARGERTHRRDHGAGRAAGTRGDLAPHQGGAERGQEPRRALGNPNGAAALRRAGKGVRRSGRRSWPTPIGMRGTSLRSWRTSGRTARRACGRSPAN